MLKNYIDINYNEINDDSYYTYIYDNKDNVHMVISFRRCKTILGKLLKDRNIIIK